ncbi:hypothetical protein L9F63_011630, partial [Diploptera punctata]
ETKRMNKKNKTEKMEERLKGELLGDRTHFTKDEEIFTILNQFETPHTSSPTETVDYGESDFKEDSRDDSGDELIPELEDSQSESDDELPLPEIDTPIPYVVCFLAIQAA